MHLLRIILKVENSCWTYWEGERLVVIVLFACSPCVQNTRPPHASLWRYDIKHNADKVLFPQRRSTKHCR
jgi:hypothetical protein